MRSYKVAALCVALLACSSLAAAQPKPDVYEDVTPRGPPLVRPAGPAVPAVAPAAPGALPVGPAPGALPAGPGPVGPPGAPGAIAPPKAPPAAVCECPLPADGGGYYGRGQFLVKDGCECKNACEFAPTPTGGKRPSCATLCECPHNVKIQTFNVKRGPVVREYPMMYGKGRRLFATYEN